jgi:hypothetical protein
MTERAKLLQLRPATNCGASGSPRAPLPKPPSLPPTIASINGIDTIANN